MGNKLGDEVAENLPEWIFVEEKQRSRGLLMQKASHDPFVVLTK
jgi:hypothetical protein